MAKRFIDTELLLNPWVRSLPTEEKLLWVAIFTRCDNAGIWVVDWDMMKLLVSPSLDPSKVLQRFSGRFIEVDNGLRWFIPSFIEFQYPKGLQEKNPAHFGVFKALKRYSIDPSKPLERSSEGTKVMDMVEEEVMEVEEVKAEVMETPDRSSNLPAIQPADITPLDPAIIAGFAHNRVNTSEGVIIAPNPTSCAMPQSWGENPDPFLWATELHKIWKAVRVEESGGIGRFTFIQIGSIEKPARDIWDNALWYLAGKVVTKSKIHRFKTYWDEKHYETDWKAKYEQLPEVQKIILKETKTERDNDAAWQAHLKKQQQQMI